MSDWLNVLQPGDGAIDIGANVGSITKRLAERVGTSGHVLAVEPDPDNAAHLFTTCLQLPQVHVVRAAVTDVYGDSVEMHIAKRGEHHSLWEANLLHGQGYTRVAPTVTLDGIAYQVPNLKAIKVDTQGAEMLVLAGATETLKKDVVWHVEVWPFGLKNAGSSVEALLDVFRRNGYQPQGITWDAVLNATHGSDHGALDVVFAK